MPGSEYEAELSRLEADLKRLEAEYNMYFAGRLPRPPVETRSRVTAAFKRYDRTHFQNTGDRFRFQSLQSRFASFVDLWDRGLRSREEGRAVRAPRHPVPEPPVVQKSGDRVVHVASITDPDGEPDKLRGLYESLVNTRAAAGEQSVPFERFADLVKKQVGKLQTAGEEVAFRVAVKDGKVTFTARALKKDGDE